MIDIARIFIHKLEFLTKLTKIDIKLVFSNIVCVKRIPETLTRFLEKAHRRDYNKPEQGGLSPKQRAAVEGSSPLDSGLLLSSHGKTEQVPPHHDHTYTSCVRQV